MEAERSVELSRTNDPGIVLSEGIGHWLCVWLNCWLSGMYIEFMDSPCEEKDADLKETS